MDAFSVAVQKAVQMAKGGLNSRRIIVERIVEEVETRVKSSNCIKVRNNICSSWALCTNNSLQKGGRVWLLWDPATFEVDVLNITSQTIHSCVQDKITGSKLWFTVVYGFNQSFRRESLWATLKDYSGRSREAWAVGGDYYNVLQYQERIGSDVTSAEITHFQNCVTWCQLYDIPAIGSYFTWNNKQGVDTRVYSIIDRTLFDAEIRRSRAPFKYYNMWSMSPGFEEIVKESWNEYVEGTKMFRVVSKLKKLKGQLKKLNKNEFNDIENNSSITYMALTQIQENLRANPMDPELIDAERAFAQDIRSRRCRNKVIQIDDLNGVCQKDGYGINTAFVEYFINILGTSKDVIDVHAATVRRGKLITTEMHYVLLKPVTAEEIKQAMFSIPGTKALGPNGYSSQFFKDNWEITGGGVIDAVMDFFTAWQAIETSEQHSADINPKS
ncbi:uncharacterized protein LOC141641413 [Silene latifolia]|uniref:uncharacterized protein LOC141641413 n=1 Tax=Silene latifolia TaxID=37657 RepID=UPI003D775E3B